MAAKVAVTSRLRGWLEDRKVLPYPAQAAPRSPAERRKWLALCLAAWITMGGALLASVPLVEDHVFLIKLGWVLLAALPVTYYMHFASFPQFWVNWAAFAAAVTVGYFEIVVNWPPGGWSTGPKLVLGYRVLACLIFWVMAFRAFTLRDAQDQVKCAIPAASAVLLALPARPSGLGLAGAALVILGTLALLTSEQRAVLVESVDQVVPQGAARGGRWRPALNSWLVLSLVVVLAGTGIAITASRVELPNRTARWLRAELAWRLARLMTGSRELFLPDPVLSLGGPAPRPSDRVLLTVRSPRALKLRRAVYETYDGSNWRQQAHRSWKRALREGRRWQLGPLWEFGLSPGASVEAEVEVRSFTYFGRHLPVPWCTREIEFDIISVRYDYTATVLTGGYFSREQSFRALVAVPTYTAPTANAPLVPAVGVKAALQLPEELPQRVRDLAKRITAESPTVREKAMAIQAYLRKRFEYDLQAPPLPEGADFVDHFLFQTRRGYCNHFSSAMAVLCRAVSVPARLAVGFNEGRYEVGRDLYVIRDQDAHSWVEAFVPHMGWIDFDPTPGEEVSEPSLLSRLYERGAGTARLAARATQAWVRGQAKVLAIGLCALAATVLASLYVRRWWRRRWGLLPAGAPAGDQVTRAYRQATGWLALKGAPREASVAPWEFFEDAAQRFPPIAQDLSLLTEKYVLARFGTQAPGESDVDTALGALGRLRDSLFANR